MISRRFLMRLPTSLRADFYVRQHGGKVHLESVLRRFRFFKWRQPYRVLRPAVVRMISLAAAISVVARRLFKLVCEICNSSYETFWHFVA